jgi:hypothetical protein
MLWFLGEMLFRDSSVCAELWVDVRVVLYIVSGRRLRVVVHARNLTAVEWNNRRNAHA